MVIFLIVKLKKERNSKMLTTPFSTDEVTMNTAIRLKTFTKQYNSLSSTPITKEEWLSSFAITIYELGLAKLNNQKLGKLYLSDLSYSFNEKDMLKKDIQTQIEENYFDNYDESAFKQYVEKQSKSISDRILSREKHP